jgi:hypothetical protein
VAGVLWLPEQQLGELAGILDANKYENVSKIVQRTRVSIEVCYACTLTADGETRRVKGALEGNWA